MTFFDGSAGWGTPALLFVCLTVALSFEFVNGFHDTANAAATVICVLAAMEHEKGKKGPLALASGRRAA